MKLDRRNFLKSLTATAAFSSLPNAFRAYAAPEDYTGKLLITVQAEGGWDVTSFCDPKLNVPGELEINHWARNRDIQTAGNISYAPVAGNQAFFDKYYQDMLVINGIDAQTNSHTAGVTHNWSGRISAGHPSLTSVFASTQAPTLPIAYINNGGYAETSGLIRYSRLDNVESMSNIIYPNREQWNINGNERYLHPSDWQRLQVARQRRLEQLSASTSTTPKQRLNREIFRSAVESSSALQDFATTLLNAGELQDGVSEGIFYSNFNRQAQLALLGMQSGVTVAADLIQWGFDTHSDHDNEQYWHLQRLTEGVDYIWRYAEELGLADRLVVVIMSDFSRTPHYNDTNGKDHWPIGSAVIMERNVNWTNRVIGLTDEGHNVLALDPNSLAASNNGEIIYPKHVMYNLREYLGLNNTEATQRFRLDNASAFDFFSV